MDSRGNVENMLFFPVSGHVPTSTPPFPVDNLVNEPPVCPQLARRDVGFSVVHFSTLSTTTTILFLKTQSALFIPGAVDNFTDQQYPLASTDILLFVL